MINNVVLSFLNFPTHTFDGVPIPNYDYDQQSWEKALHMGQRLIEIEGGLKEKEEKIASLGSVNNLLRKSNDDKDDTIKSYYFTVML